MILEELVGDAGPLTSVDAFEDHARCPVDRVLTIDCGDGPSAQGSLAVHRPVDKVQLGHDRLLLLAFTVPFTLDLAA